MKHNFPVQKAKGIINRNNIYYTLPTFLVALRTCDPVNPTYPRRLIAVCVFESVQRASA